MPRYQYKCPRCGTVEEQTHGMQEDPEYKCGMFLTDEKAFCGGILKKVFSATPAIFKGGGWAGKGN